MAINQSYANEGKTAAVLLLQVVKYIYFVLLAVGLTLGLSSCGYKYNPPTKLYYASLRPTIVKDKNQYPLEDATILARYAIDQDGKVNVYIKNLTDDILIIDQTKSFFINASHQSRAYYDSTIRTQTDSYTSGSGARGAFNLGGVANAFGIGGVAGALMNATTVGGASESATTTTNTTVIADLPQVSIAPRGEMQLSKAYDSGLGYYGNTHSTPDNSPYTFSVCISYSFDNGESWDKLITDFYCNDSFIIPVKDSKTNDAVMTLLTRKPNATKEPWYIIFTDRCADDPFFKYGIFTNYQ